MTAKEVKKSTKNGKGIGSFGCPLSLEEAYEANNKGLTWGKFFKYVGMTLISVMVLAFIYGIFIGATSVKGYDYTGLCYADRGPDVVYECKFKITGETDL